MEEVSTVTTNICEIRREYVALIQWHKLSLIGWSWETTASSLVKHRWHEPTGGPLEFPFGQCQMFDWDTDNYAAERWIHCPVYYIRREREREDKHVIHQKKKKTEDKHVQSGCIQFVISAVKFLLRLNITVYIALILHLYLCLPLIGGLPRG